MVIVVPKDSPAKLISDLVAMGKAKPGGLFYGWLSATNLLAEMFKTSSGVPVTGVQYKAMGQAVTDLLAARYDFFISSLQPLEAHIQSGGLRAIGVATGRRLEVLPNVPTMAEAGYPSVDLDLWHGLFAPAGVPDSTVRTLQASFARALEEPAARQVLASQGSSPVGMSPEEFGKILASDRAKVAKVIQEAGIKIEN